MPSVLPRDLSARPASAVHRLLEGVSKLLGAGRTPAVPAAIAASHGADGERRPADFCRKYGPTVYRRCLSLLGDERAAGAATQHVLVALARDARLLDGVDDPVAILRRVYGDATAHCRDVLRARDDLAACDGAV